MLCNILYCRVQFDTWLAKEDEKFHVGDRDTFRLSGILQVKENACLYPFLMY